MTIIRLPPTQQDIEPVYIYDDPNQHLIHLHGIYIDQKGIGRIRSVSSSPEDMDRIAQTPLLSADSNHDYANLHAGGPITQYQRTLSMRNVESLRDWWELPSSLSANSTLIWLPAGVTTNQFDNTMQEICGGNINPASWCQIECPHCNQGADQYGDDFVDHYFDYCRSCGQNWRPGRIIDGQHRIRAMADRNLPNNRYSESILVTLLLQQQPLGIQPQDAAKLFIEINAGGTDLDRDHKDFLSSHFDILNFSEPRIRSAYNIARDLNLAAHQPYDEWSEDTAVTPRRGRLSMMPNTPQSDIMPAWRIQEFVTKIVGREYPAKNPVTGDIEYDTIYEWPNPPANLEQTIRHDLSHYLRAITNVWVGGTGPKTPPLWFRNRIQRGILQQAYVIRALLNLMPIIIRRIEISGRPKDLNSFESELRLLRDISFQGAWQNNLRGDTGINKFSKIMNRLLLEADYGWTPPGPTQGHWANIADWYNGEHDSFSITNFTSTISAISFDLETVCGVQTTIVEPCSILGEGSNSLLFFRVASAGGANNDWTVKPFTPNPATNTIEIDTPFSLGDVIELRIQLSTSLNENLVDDQDFQAGAPVQTTVV